MQPNHLKSFEPKDEGGGDSGGVGGLPAIEPNAKSEKSISGMTGTLPVRDNRIGMAPCDEFLEEVGDVVSLTSVICRAWACCKAKALLALMSSTLFLTCFNFQQNFSRFC